VSDTFEGDLIRPLGVVTLHFGYVEYEIDSFLERLSLVGLLPDAWSQRPIGQKLALLEEAILPLGQEVLAQLQLLLIDVRVLLEERNALIHGCIVGGGRVVSGRAGVTEGHTSPAELTILGERAFSWKERLFSYRWKVCEPVLRDMAPPNKSLERSRER
jgi:hypothetical protein